jgi:Fe2+ transport system protein FeoA
MTHSWQPIEWGALSDAEPPTPSIGGLVYPGSLALVYGEPETMKSWLALVLALEQARAGQHVVFIDLEATPRQIRARLEALGATRNELVRVHYLTPSEPISDPAIRSDVDAMLSTWEPSLIVVDALAGALALHGLDQNSNGDVETFYSRTLELFRSSGAAVLLIDHVTKDRETRGRWPIGAQRKLGGADVGLLVESVSPFSRGGKGLARLRVQKDREGALKRPIAAELELVSDADTGAITWTFKEASTATPEDGDAWKPTELMRRVFEFLKAQAGPVSRSTIERGVSGRTVWVRRAVDALLDEETIREIPGARGARLVELSTPSRDPVPDPVPYRERDGDGVPSPLSLSDPVPDPVPDGDGVSESRSDGIPF